MASEVSVSRQQGPCEDPGWWHLIGMVIPLSSGRVGLGTPARRSLPRSSSRRRARDSRQLVSPYLPLPQSLGGGYCEKAPSISATMRALHSIRQLRMSTRVRWLARRDTEGWSLT